MRRFRIFELEIPYKYKNDIYEYYFILQEKISFLFFFKKWETINYFIKFEGATDYIYDICNRNEKISIKVKLL